MPRVLLILLGAGSVRFWLSMLFVQENVGEPIAVEKAFSATLPYDNCKAVNPIMALIRAYAFLCARLVSSGHATIGRL